MVVIGSRRQAELTSSEGKYGGVTDEGKRDVTRDAILTYPFPDCNGSTSGVLGTTRGYILIHAR